MSVLHASTAMLCPVRAKLPRYRRSLRDSFRPRILPTCVTGRRCLPVTTATACKHWTGWQCPGHCQCLGHQHHLATNPTYSHKRHTVSSQSGHMPCLSSQPILTGWHMQLSDSPIDATIRLRSPQGRAEAKQHCGNSNKQSATLCHGSDIPMQGHLAALSVSASCAVWRASTHTLIWHQTALVAPTQYG
jgi:hypothetical protein